MLEISENALMMSVQAIHFATRHLGAEREAAAGPLQAGYDEIIEAYGIVAAELRQAYAQARARGCDLPSYAALVGQA